MHRRIFIRLDFETCNLIILCISTVFYNTIIIIIIININKMTFFIIYCYTIIITTVLYSECMSNNLLSSTFFGQKCVSIFLLKFF